MKEKNIIKMSEKQQIIQAFKSLDFEALENLLDDNKPYMDVTKELFLSALKLELKNVKSYDNVLEGVCQHCNKGCKAYSFTKKHHPSLNLFFEEEEDKITQVYLCGNIKVKNPDDEGLEIYLSFYEEEKVNFKESSTYLHNLQKIHQATEELHLITSGNIPKIKDIVAWHNKHKALASFNGPFEKERYKAYEKFSSTYSEIRSLVYFYDKNDDSQPALKEYYNIDSNNEKEVVCWVLAHKDSYFYNILKKPTNWKKTGFIEIDTEPGFIVDCSECLDALLFADLYDKLSTNLMNKYRPTYKQIEDNGGSVDGTLEAYLTLHKKYLDIL